MNVDGKRMKKPTMEFNRASTPKDSQEPGDRKHAVTIKGADEPVVTNMQAILDALYISDADRKDDGSYEFKKNTVTLFFKPTDADGMTWQLNIRTTRSPKPVQTGLTYNAKDGADGEFVLTKGFVNHTNDELDNQFINNPEMHDFTLYSAMKEIRREKEPEWWYAHLQAFDKDNGTNYADAFWTSLNTGKAAPGTPHA